MSSRPATALDLSLGNQRPCPVVAAARRALAGSQYLALRSIQCAYFEGRLVLHGKVPTFYLMQVAQELVCRLPGVSELENRLQVIGLGGEQDGSSVSRNEPWLRTQPKASRRIWGEAAVLSDRVPSA